MKRLLTREQQQSLRTMLQVATAAALMDSRRWEPGDMAFQGGTCLHLAHGSARFSEDLDFMVRGGLSLHGLSKEVQKKLRLPADLPADLGVAVTPGREARNPYTFFVTLSGPMVVGSVRVKIKLSQTPAAVLKSLQLRVSTLPSPAGQAFVPTLTLPEIFADKVYALGGRGRVKPRDLYDLWWLCEKGTPPLTAMALRARLEIYPATSGKLPDTQAAWLANAAQRLQDLEAKGAAKQVASDLKRWLPSSWPMDQQLAAQMLQLAATQLRAGMVLMQGVGA